MAGQVMKTLDLGKPSKNEKNEKKTNLCPHGRYQRHPHQPDSRKTQDRQPLYVAALTAELQVLTLTLK
jgi:hypothetical protein